MCHFYYFLFFIAGECREIQSKEIMLEEKLGTLESLQSNVQAYLTLSSAFINSASKYELLKLANGLVERLSDIGAVVQPTKYLPCNVFLTFGNPFIVDYELMQNIAGK